MAENGNANFSMVLISPEWLYIQSLNFQGSMYGTKEGPRHGFC